MLPTCVPADHRWSGYWGGPAHLTLDLGFGSWRVGQFTCSSLSSPLGWVLQHCSSYFSSWSDDQGIESVLLSHPQGLFSPPVPSGPSLSCCPDEVEGSFPWVLQLTGDRDSSPALLLMASGPGLLAETWGGQDRAESLPSRCFHKTDEYCGFLFLIVDWT